METQKSASKNHNSSFLRHCCCCVAAGNDDDLVTLQQRPGTVAEKHEVSVTYQKTSSYYVTSTQMPIENASDAPEAAAPMHREQKEELVKAILSKYLAIKREERLNKQSLPVEDRPASESNKNQNSDFLHVECFSSDSSETLVLGDKEKRKKTTKPPQFPTKSKSAPTTNISHDSLADICFKMSGYKQLIENKSSDSYVTCCSNENAAPGRKKLELIFNQSSDEMFSPEDSSVASLQYNINCEKKDTRSELNKTRRGSKLTNSQASGEIGGCGGSTGSLKWKLIISHHSHGGKKN